MPHYKNGEKMKILQTVHSFPPERGGVEHHVYEISKRLAKNNEVTVFTTQVEGTKDAEVVEGINIRRFFSLGVPLFKTPKFTPTMFLNLLREDADIYCSHHYGSLMPFITSLVALVKRKPFVFTLHGYPKLKGKRAFFQFLYKVFIASVFLRIADKVIVVSKNSIDDIGKELDTSKISYIPNGINPDDFEGIAEQGDAITYIGKLNEDKGIETLLSAYSRIKEKYPLNLMIVGQDDGSKEKLENLARKLKIEPTFLEVPYSNMKDVYRKSRVVILPSKYEGLSLVWLESIASGKPMFSTPVGDAKHLFEQLYGNKSESFLFQNEDELIQKLRNFLASEADFQKTIKKAEYMCKEEYSWDNVSSLTKHAYEGVLGQ